MALEDIPLDYKIDRKLRHKSLNTQIVDIIFLTLLNRQARKAKKEKQKRL